jgi:hypothetical protein
VATLKPGVSLTQAEPLLKVDNRLEPGRHRFQLEVIDDAGLVSDPALLVVVVTPLREPDPPPTRGGTIDPRILTRVATTRVTPITIRKPPIR